MTEIAGYRVLNPDEVKLVNEAKELGAALQDFIKKLGTYQFMISKVEIDYRWLEIAKTDLQTGLMALIRSITRPANF